jgi:hypothetical protein
MYELAYFKHAWSPFVTPTYLKLVTIVNTTEWRMWRQAKSILSGQSYVTVTKQCSRFSLHISLLIALCQLTE